jgi:hypothetical protein
MWLAMEADMADVEVAGRAWARWEGDSQTTAGSWRAEEEAEATDWD